MHQPDENQIKIHKQTAAFAAEYIACRPDLQTGQEFPMDIWRKMGEAGLFQIGIAEIYGGAGGGYLDLLKGGEAFVKSGYNLGLAVSWLYQQIIAHYVINVFGTPQQRRQYLPAAAEGKTIFSFAVSEPGHGSRPKLLTTKAQKHEKHFVLNGEKTYLTNGPIADVFIVIACTDDIETKKRFTAFILPRNGEGVTVTPPLAINFLKPSPHGGIKLENCVIGQRFVLGKEGSAWPDIVVPFGEIEDVVMMGPALGGMAAQLTMLMDTIREHQTETNRALEGELGALHALLQTLRIIAYEAADQLDRGNGRPIPIMITFGRLAAEFHTGIGQMTDNWKSNTPAECDYLQRDMGSLLTLKKRLLQIRQEKIGRALLNV
ncbi:MAG: acyl-CoA dehydrogenase domain-containing protein [Syntrophaceae bacterium]|nr:MAG: acyl-CoA dehydrogenase domain-containing protein [Syntrophaceae bacterium]